MILLHILIIAMQFGFSEENQYIGGSTNNIVRLSQYFTQQGHRVMILTSPPKYPSNQKPVPWADICFVHPRGSFMRLRYNIEFIILTTLALVRLKHTFQPDVIHGHSAYAAFGLLLRFASWILAIPVFFTIYSPLESKSHFRSLVDIITNPITVRLIFLKDVLLIPTSSFVKQSLEDIGLTPHERIYPIVDFDRFRPLNEEVKRVQRQNLGLSSDSFIVFYLGNLRWNKGLSDLLDALERIHESHENIKLIIILALDMPRDESIKRMRLSLHRRSLLNITKHVGITSQVNTLMSISDIVAIPFRNTIGPADPPVSILEAMAAGSVVITTSVGGIPEVVVHQENGFLVPPNSPEELAKCLYDLIENPTLRERVSTIAPVSVESICSVENAGLLYMKLYNDIKRR